MFSEGPLFINHSSLSFKDQFLAFIRNCVYCGSFLSPTHLFCPKCWESLLNQMKWQRIQLTGLPFPVFALWKWGGCDVKVTQLIYGMKKGFYPYLHPALVRELAFDNPDLFRFHKKEQSKLCGINQNNQTSKVFIPAPPRSFGEKDHAYYFAQALADRYGVLLERLIRRHVISQKKLGVLERKTIQMGLIEEGHMNAQTLSGQKIVFVDDVLTTGSTALAAYNKLGQPSGFIAVVLAYRPLLK